jgi:hypothetical protein
MPKNNSTIIVPRDSGQTKSCIPFFRQGIVPEGVVSPAWPGQSSRQKDLDYLGTHRNDK